MKKPEESSEKTMTYQDALKLVPRYIYEHITKRMYYIRGKVLPKLMVYLVASDKKGTLSEENAPKIVRDYYQIRDSPQEDKDNWKSCDWLDHPGKGRLLNLRHKLLEHRNAVMHTDRIITLGELADDYRVHIYRRIIEPKWVLETGIPDQETSPFMESDQASMSSSIKSDTVQTFHSISTSDVFDKISACKGLVQLCFTGYPKTVKWNKALETALRNGAHVEMLLYHPECDFAKLRSIVMGGNISEIVKHNRELLKNIKQNIEKTGKIVNLEVRLTSEFISTQYCRIFDPDRNADEIYFGIYWSGEGMMEGPYFLVQATSRIGTFLSDQYRGLWDSQKSTYKDNVSKDVPKPHNDEETEEFDPMFHPLTSSGPTDREEKSKTD